MDDMTILNKHVSQHRKDLKDRQVVMNQEDLFMAFEFAFATLLMEQSIQGNALICPFRSYPFE